MVVSLGADSVTILSSAYADGRYRLYYGVGDLPLGELRVATREDETTRGAEGDDLLAGTRGADILYGLGGDDHLDGRAGDDTLYGNGGKDTLYGSAGDDILYGGAGADILYGDGGDGGFDTGNNPASGQARDDGIRGYNAAFSGTPGNDILYGDAGGDFLYGGGGDDTLLGGADADTYTFNTGDGTDTVIDDGGSIVFVQENVNDYVGATYTFTRPDASGAAVTLTVRDSGGNILNVIKFTTYPSAGYNFYTHDNTNGMDTPIPASLLVVPPRVLGSEGNPFLATAAADIFTGSSGNDWVSYEDMPFPIDDVNFRRGVEVDLRTATATVKYGWAAGDTLTGINNLIGSDYYDTLTGNDADNILRGGDGTDYLDGGLGADILDGGAGFDSVSYTSSSKGVRVSLLSQGQAQQDFETNSFSFVANGNEAVGDILYSIIRIFGSEHNDWLTGDGGHNKIHGHQGNDRLEGGAGIDILYGGAGNDYLYGGDDRDILIGDDGVDILQGGNGNDEFYGGEGADVLFGDEGNDRLVGSEGADTLYGGAGEDTYAFGEGDGTDTIHDEAGDTMLLQFYGHSYGATDFTKTSNNFNRVGNNLEITIDDKITIVDAYNDDPNIGTGNSAFTINIEYGGGSPLTEGTTDAFWHYL